MQPPAYEDASMHPEFQATPNQAAKGSSHVEHMLSAVSNILLQVNHTNQSLLNFLSHTQPMQRSDPKIRPKSFAGLPTEDVLTWLDHFENIAGYHQWTDERKAMEIRTLFDNIAATWYLQQEESTKTNWCEIKTRLIENFAHRDITQTALQQLQTLKQQQNEPVAQFAVKMNQLLIRADPKMSEEMRLFFLWPRMRHDLARRVRDQGPTSFHAAIQIAQRIETALSSELPPSSLTHFTQQRQQLEPPPTPMDIDIQNVQMGARRQLPDRDAQGKPRCFHCNLYGHVKRHCRKLKT